MKKAKTGRQSGIDWVLFIMVMALMILGLIMQYSASGYDLSLVEKQAIFGAAGIAAIFIISLLPVKFIYGLSFILYPVALAATAATPVIGRQVKGAKRWIEFQGIRFQPSELVKAALILILAVIICKYINEINNRQPLRLLEIGNEIRTSGFGGFLRSIRGYLVMIAITGIAAVDVAIATKDLGTAVIIFGTGFIIMWVISPRRRYLIITAVLAIGAAVFLISAFSYRGDRVNAWLHLDADTSDIGYQIKQGLYAIGSGGWFGKGLGKSIQKDFIPESHTDMIFSVICEELGIIGGIIVIVLFVLVILRMHKIYDQVSDLFGKVIVMGVSSHIALQAFVNLAVLTNLIPNTGIPLPFISYGGTSLLCLMGEIGLVMCIRRAGLDMGRSSVYDAKHSK